MRGLLTAEIIAVGSELLTPFRSDTNSLYLTARLNELGIAVRAKVIVGDDLADLVVVLGHALLRADVVILTGGLGPTADDITRDAVAFTLQRPLAEDPAILASLRERFAARGFPMPEINRRQAQVPMGATTLANANGSAPGLWIDLEAEDRVLVLLPGPPRELKAMFDAQVESRLARRTGGRRLRRRVIKMTGRAESQVDEVAQPLYLQMAKWPLPVQTTILASPGQIELHLAAGGLNTGETDRVLDEAARTLAEALNEIVFSTDGRGLAEVVGDRLRDRGARIAVAESCTGGLVLGRLTDVPGSSQWVVGGVMAYANEVKIEQLGVAASLIAEHGAVSEPVAVAMAEGVRARLHADVGIGVTGVAGPGGGTPSKPAGTVMIAVCGRLRESVFPSTDEIPIPGVVRTFRFIGDRQMVRLQATQAALDMVRRALL